MNQANWARWVAVPSQELSLGGNGGFALKRVRPGTILTLLFTKRTEDRLRSGTPAHVERRYVAGCVPVAVSKTHRVAKRINFPLALADPRMHVSFVVGLPRKAGDRAGRA
ncbi:MAG: hypothetical protein JWP08_677 [Bryobacterales bacterium]|nr:hypothetical protein [Bryobacterales bacterium]